MLVKPRQLHMHPPAKVRGDVEQRIEGKAAMLGGFKLRPAVLFKSALILSISADRNLGLVASSEASVMASQTLA